VGQNQPVAWFDGEPVTVLLLQAKSKPAAKHDATARNDVPRERCDVRRRCLAPATQVELLYPASQLILGDTSTGPAKRRRVAPLAHWVKQAIYQSASGSGVGSVSPARQSNPRITVKKRGTCSEWIYCFHHGLRLKESLKYSAAISSKQASVPLHRHGSVVFGFVVNMLVNCCTKHQSTADRPPPVTAHL